MRRRFRKSTTLLLDRDGYHHCDFDFFACISQKLSCRHHDENLGRERRILRGVKKCAFCTRSADSDEHIFSTWMLKLLPPNQRYLLHERIVSQDEYIRYPKKNIKITANAVCTQCNNGWMSEEIETPLKSVLKDAFFDEIPQFFTLPELALISAFAFKTLVMANHKDLKTFTPFFPASERFRFRRERRIPDGVQVWMATRKLLPGKYHVAPTQPDHGRMSEVNHSVPEE
jgi:hypothetical protein